MTALIYTCIAKYNYYIHEISDPRVSQYFLMGTPLNVSIIILFYYLFSTKYGPIFMKYREPFSLDKLMMAYNLSQILMNSFFVYLAFTLVWIPRRYTFACQMPGNSPVDDEVVKDTYLFFLCRLCDLIDTVFMIFRKKHKQISFLHVYHHILVASCSWLHAKYIPGGHVILFGTLNAIVHVVMYTYYFTTALYPQKNDVWWKRHITEIQMAQFVILAVQQVVGLLSENCEYPKMLLIFYLTQALYMLYLFGQFYYKSYLKPSQKKED